MPNPGTSGGEIFATLLHFSGSNERLVWGSQIEKSKVSRHPTILNCCSRSDPQSNDANIRLRPNIHHDSTGGFQLQII
jgi:hypothetical protein